MKVLLPEDSPGGRCWRLEGEAEHHREAEVKCIRMQAPNCFSWNSTDFNEAPPGMNLSHYKEA